MHLPSGADLDRVATYLLKSIHHALNNSIFFILLYRKPVLVSMTLNPALASPLCAQIFDSGLIGEGALHAVAAAQAKLLQPDAILVPASATLYCQPLQLRRAATATGLDVSAANRWHWRPDYEGIELGLCR